jgi:hypothetical protein
MGTSVVAPVVREGQLSACIDIMSLIGEPEQEGLPPNLNPLDTATGEFCERDSEPSADRTLAVSRGPGLSGRVAAW